MLNIDNIFPDSTAEILKGGKPAALGEIRTFGNKKYQKTSNGWRPVPKKESVAKESKEESTTSSVSKIIDGFKSINSKYSDSDVDRDKMSLERTDSGNWRLYYDGKDTGTVMNKDIISEVDAKKEGFIKPNPWPESIDKLTIRSDDDDIYDAAIAFVDHKITQLHGEEALHGEEWNRELIRLKNQFFKEKSKTAKINLIKSKYKELDSKIKADKKEKEYSEWAESSEGKKYIEEELLAKKKNDENFLQNIDKIEKDFHEQITKQLGNKIPIDKVRVQSEKVIILPKGSSYDVEIYYSKRGHSDEREYRVQTTSYGGLTPDSQYVNNILLQAELLTNKSLIEVTKNVVMTMSDLDNKHTESVRQIREKYSKIKKW